jgi:hypothetical protein
MNVVWLAPFPLTVTHDQRPSFSSLPCCATFCVHGPVTLVKVPPGWELASQGIKAVEMEVGFYDNVEGGTFKCKKGKG